MTTAEDAVGQSDDAGPAETEGSLRVGQSSRVGTAVVVVVSVGFAALLGGTVGSAGVAGSTATVALVVATALSFAASLRLADAGRFRVLAYPLAGVLALVVGAGVAVAVGSVALGHLSTSYPVQSFDQVRIAGLSVLSATIVALGATVATLGGVASIGRLLRGETAEAYADLAVKTFLVPLTVSALLLVPTLLAGSTAPEPTLADLFAAALGLPVALLDLLAFPAGDGTHLLTFAALVVAAAGGLDRALDAAPVSELSTGPSGERTGAALERVRRRLRVLAVVAAAVVPVALVELALAQSALANALGPVYAPLAAVTNATALRLPMVALLVVSLAVWTVSELLGRTVRTNARDLAGALAPFLGGVAVVCLAVAVQGVVLDPALTAVSAGLPGEFGTAFERQSTALVENAGAVAVALAVTAGLVGLTVVLAVAVTLATQVGVLDDRATAPALAAVGLFVASGFGPGAGVGAPLVLAGLVGSFLVWDAGEYGITVAREVGRAGHTYRPELAHIGGTLAVGAAAAVLAWGLADVAVGAAFGSLPTLRLAFVALLAGIVLLVASLR